jgi:hypothetical protein
VAAVIDTARLTRSNEDNIESPADGRVSKSVWRHRDQRVMASFERFCRNYWVFRIDEQAACDQTMRVALTIMPLKQFSLVLLSGEYLGRQRMRIRNSPSRNCAPTLNENAQETSVFFFD